MTLRDLPLPPPNMEFHPRSVDESMIGLGIRHIRAMGDVMVIRLSGVLDVGTAPAMRSLVVDLANGTIPAVLLDLSELESIDGSGVAVLVSLYKRLRDRGAPMRITAVRSQPLAILELLKLDRVLIGK